MSDEKLEVELSIDFYNLKQNPFPFKKDKKNGKEIENPIKIGDKNFASFNSFSKNTIIGLILKNIGCNLRLYNTKGKDSAFSKNSLLDEESNIKNEIEKDFYETLVKKFEVKDYVIKEKLICYNLQTMHKTKPTSKNSSKTLFSNGIIKPTWINDVDNIIFKDLVVYLKYLKKIREIKDFDLNNLLVFLLQEDDIEKILNYLFIETKEIFLEERNSNIFKIELNNLKTDEVSFDRNLVIDFVLKNNFLLKKLEEKISPEIKKRFRLSFENSVFEEKNNAKNLLLLIFNYLYRKLIFKYECYEFLNQKITIPGVSAKVGGLTLKDVFQYSERKDEARNTTPVNIKTTSGNLTVFLKIEKEIFPLFKEMLLFHTKNFKESIKICHGFGKIKSLTIKNNYLN